jgi:hypothetical protein
MHLNRPPVWSVSPAQVRPKWARLWAKPVLAVAHDGSPLPTNFATRRPGEIVGTVTRTLKPYIGYGQGTAGNSTNGLRWRTELTAYQKATFATIVQFNSFTTIEVMLATDDGNSGGLRMQVSAGALQVTAIGVANVDSGITLATGVPYFLAMSVDAERDVMNVVVRELNTDKITSTSVAFTATPTAGTTGYASFGYGRTTNESVDGLMAMGFIAADAMPLAFLSDWATDPWGPFRYWDEAKVVYAKAGGNVTLALTGVTATGTAGALSPSVAAALTGTSAAGAIGSVTAGADVTAAISGVSATATTGSLGVDRTKALSGVSATGQVGTGNVTRNSALSGASASAQSGTVTQSRAVALAGAPVTGAVGSVGATQAGVASLTGTPATASAGTATASLSVAATGVSGSGQVGAPAVARESTIAGVGASSTVGSVGLSVTVALSGITATASVGTVVVPSGDIVVAITGVSVIGLVGTMTGSDVIYARAPSGPGYRRTFENTTRPTQQNTTRNPR